MHPQERFQVRLAEVQQFLQFAMRKWPELKGSVASQLVRRCAKCILPETYAPFVGEVCEICCGAAKPDAGDPGHSQGDQGALAELLKAAQGQGGQAYDAALMFSGGKDSAYLLHRLVTDFPNLRLLAVTIDNGFMSQVALGNCQATLTRIRVDHLLFRPQPELFVKTFRHALLNLNEGGCYTTVDRMDGDLTFDICRHLAARQEIPLLLAGLSPGQVRRILELDSFESKPEWERSRRRTSAGFSLQQLYSEDEQRKYWWDGSRLPVQRVPRVLYPFYAWGYDEEAIREQVVQLGLIEPGMDNPLITNNDLIPVMLAVDICRLGYSGFEPEFAELVRAGKADRQTWLAMFQALEYLAKRGQFLPQSVSETLRRLDMTPQQVGIPTQAARAALVDS